jgi:heat-inducible transcriptional repressor
MATLRNPEASQADRALELSERERLVLRALVAAYIAEAAPVGSGTISHLLSVPLSSASIRSTVAALRDRGLVEQPHKSAGSIPTSQAIQVFVHHLMDEPELAEYERRSLRASFDDVDATGAVRLASTLLSERARQLGFAVAPRLPSIRLQHVSFVRASSERVLVVLVARSGRVHRRTIEHAGVRDQADLDRIAAMLNERIVGHTLSEVRSLLQEELAQLRNRAGDLLARALSLGLRALAIDEAGPPDLLLGTRLALLDQPEFHDPERIRELFTAIETGESLLELLDRVVLAEGVQVALGDELEATELRRLALVAAPYGREGDSPQGVLGVIGPCRMDYRRVIPLVEYCSTIVSNKLVSADETAAQGNS